MSSNIILADNGVSSGTAGIKESGGSDGTLLLQTTTSGGTPTTAVTIDANQNVGVGVTPSSWSGVKAIEVYGLGSALVSGGNNDIELVSNAYYNGSWKYAATGAAAHYYQSSGVHYWRIANSGSTGGTVSFTQAMTLDNSGYLYLNTTSKLAGGTTSQLQINSSAGLTNSTCAVMQDGGTTYSSSAQYILFSNSSGATAGYIYHSSSTAVAFTQTSDKRLKTDNGVVTDVSYLDKTIVHDFTWTECGTKDRGVFAQDEYENNPRNVQAGKDDLTEDGHIKNPWTVNYTGYIPDLIVYCQQLKKQVTELSAKVTALEAKVGV